MPDITIHQHYVWRYYLRQWANNDQIYCLRNSKVFPVNIMKIAQERLFYQFYECTDEEFAIAYHYSDPASKPLLDQFYKMNYVLKTAKQDDLELYNSLIEFNKDFELVPTCYGNSNNDLNK